MENLVGQFAVSCAVLNYRQLEIRDASGLLLKQTERLPFDVYSASLGPDAQQVAL